ncbi:Hypothetical predicted protein [Olea europaea subsp. europaea]|uniref:Uncharacterized protein n=1 Tax=Olea europaea subsp. europaea TaxID=158383 RepID=A0A8S0S2J4_OLEEU|nr:Hypothetical predicted protein [Olea europaea subsp. europaea]
MSSPCNSNPAQMQANPPPPPPPIDPKTIQPTQTILQNTKTTIFSPHPMIPHLLSTSWRTLPNVLLCWKVVSTMTSARSLERDVPPDVSEEDENHFDEALDHGLGCRHRDH